MAEIISMQHSKYVIFSCVHLVNFPAIFRDYSIQCEHGAKTLTANCFNHSPYLVVRLLFFFHDHRTGILNRTSYLFSIAFSMVFDVVVAFALFLLVNCIS